MNLKGRKSQNIRDLIGKPFLPPIDPKVRAKQQVSDYFNKNEINPRIDDPAGGLDPPLVSQMIAMDIINRLRKRRK